MKNLLGNEIKFISVSFSVIPEIYIFGLKMLIQITFFFVIWRRKLTNIVNNLIRECFPWTAYIFVFSNKKVSGFIIAFVIVPSKKCNVKSCELNEELNGYELL